MSRMTTNARSAGQLVQIMLDVVLAQPLTMIGVVAVLFVADPLLTLLTFVVLPIVLVPVLLFAGKIRKATQNKYKKLEASGNFFHQMLDGIRVVKGYRLEDAQRDEFNRVSQEVFSRERKVARYKGTSRFGVEFTYNTLLALGLFAVGYMMTTPWFAEAGRLPLLVMFFAGLVFLYDPARKLGHSFNDIQESTAGLDRVFELMDRVPEVQDKSDAAEAPHDFETIEFDHLGFEYIEDRPVLRDIDLTVKRGEMIALVGQSGQGKSTLMDLIPRFYDPTDGAIRVDGTDLRDFKLESWLRNIAIVSQDTFLFNTTVRDNIRAGRPEATEEQIIEAARAAHIWAEIQDMPKGLDTRLGDRGVTISGGQRQRIAIARAFLRKSPILLLDEATSSLDTESEREVQKALDELIEECTV
jgi:subfamily B ATP-binding cassette protein MsbA